MMKINKNYTIAYRRKRNKKTNYRTRLKLLISRKPRLVIRKTLKKLTAQIIEYSATGDRVIVSASTTELKELGWHGAMSNTPSSYLLGMLIAKKALNKNINDCITDIGLHPSTKGSRIYAVIKGAIDTGLKVPCNKEVLPNEERIRGQHIMDYFTKIKDPERHKRQFSVHMKNNFQIGDLSKEFDKVKARILGK